MDRRNFLGGIAALAASTTLGCSDPLSNKDNLPKDESGEAGPVNKIEQFNPKVSYNNHELIFAALYQMVGKDWDDFVLKIDAGSDSYKIQVEDKSYLFGNTYTPPSREGSSSSPVHTEGCIFSLNLNELFEKGDMEEGGTYNVQLIGQVDGKPVASSDVKEVYFPVTFFNHNLNFKFGTDDSGAYKCGFYFNVNDDVNLEGKTEGYVAIGTSVEREQDFNGSDKPERAPNGRVLLYGETPDGGIDISEYIEITGGFISSSTYNPEEFKGTDMGGEYRIELYKVENISWIVEGGRKILVYYWKNDLETPNLLERLVISSGAFFTRDQLKASFFESLYQEN